MLIQLISLLSCATFSNITVYDYNPQYIHGDRLDYIIYNITPEPISGSNLKELNTIIILYMFYYAHAESECSKAQTLYFFIDATQSNTFENFCPLIYTMQMLVATLNPSSTSKTQIGAMLFADEAKEIEPSSVFSIGTSCHDAIQGDKSSLRSLMLEYGRCLDEDRKYSSPKYPSMCGEGTSALGGLEEIYEVISNKEKSGVVLMLTDGIINDDAMKRDAVLKKFKEAKITIIGAGIGKASELGDNMKDYTSINLIKEDPVELGIAIVNEMESQKVLCSDEGNS